MSVKLLQSSPLSIIQQSGVVAYRAMSKKTVEEYVKMLISIGHESVLEHCYFTFEIVCDRGVSHELVRHRIASYTQESTRYVDFSKKDIYFNITDKLDNDDRIELENHLKQVMSLYDKLNKKYGKDIARGVLPNITLTKIIATFNARSLRNFIKLRLDNKAHFEIKKIASEILDCLGEEYSVLFKDIIGEVNERN